MIHYTCDRCNVALDPAEQTRYVVHVEVHAVGDQDGDAVAQEADLDSLSELHLLLEGVQGKDSIRDHELPAHRGRYDLCPECYRQFLLNPLGRDTPFALHFSNN